MDLRISGQTVDKYSSVEINLQYNSIADTFNFTLYNDPYDKRSRDFIKPLSYYPCLVTHGGELLISGTILSHKYFSAGDPPSSLVGVSGYSKTGILEDCSVINTISSADIDITPAVITLPSGATSFQFTNTTLANIAKSLCTFYGIDVIIDDDLNSDPLFTKPYTASVVNPDETVKAFLNKLCAEKHVLMTHTSNGNLLLTRIKGGTLKQYVPVATRFDTLQNKGVDYLDDPGTVAGSYKLETKYDAHIGSIGTGDNYMRAIKSTLDVDGQKMHRVVRMVGQANGSTDNATDTILANPLATAGAHRYRCEIAQTGDDTTAPRTARSVIGEELKGISLTIEMQGWNAANGRLWRPNNLITFVDPECGIYQPTTFFVNEVTLRGDNVKDTATLRCVLPECYSEDPIKNIF